jgi:AcrR family transcriptional regulator
MESSMSRKSLVEVRREEILLGFERCIIKYGLDVSLEQIAAETGVKRSIIRHYIGNRDEVIEAFMDRIAREYIEDIRAKITAIIETGSESAFLNYLFDVEEEYADWDSVIINVLVTSKERYPSAKQKLQHLFNEVIELFAHALTKMYPNATWEQSYRIGYALYCLITTNETIQWIGLSRDLHIKARESAELLLQTLKSTDTLLFEN